MFIFYILSGFVFFAFLNFILKLSVIYRFVFFMFGLFFSFTNLANTNASLLVDKLNKEALDLAYTKPKEALIIAFRSLKLASSKDLSYGEIRAYIRIGIIYDVLDKNEAFYLRHDG